jgi:thioredoxin 1
MMQQQQRQQQHAAQRRAGVGTILLSLWFVPAATAFAPSTPLAFRTQTPVVTTIAKVARTPLTLSAVVDIGSESAFDQTIASAGGSLVVVDYSTTWCGPCKVIAPKFEELSEKYGDAVFLKVIGDASPDASKLMKREGVRSVPSFHYFKNGEKVDVVNGANAEAIEAAIAKHGAER